MVTRGHNTLDKECRNAEAKRGRCLVFIKGSHRSELDWDED